ncbi:MAG: 50S ribosomal protein L11 methyltransferase [Pseudomonadota bacterium]|nr:50S ribosomal protein L11 methyltransferase [Pseudomonadota bacterium]
MTTYTAFTKVSGNALAKNLLDLVSQMEPKPVGVGSVQLEDGSKDWEIGVYFQEKPNPIQISILETIFNIEFVISNVPDKDWVSEVQRGLKPVKVGRFTIVGSHDKSAVSINKTGLLIEAAMAFGTGHHASTVGCLNAFNYVRRLGTSIDNVVDIGCGTGVLAMAAAKVGCSKVVASDVDTIALKTARINILKNGLSARILIVKSDGFRNHTFYRMAPFDLVFANILARPLCSLSKQIHKFLKRHGIVILSGILNSQSNMVQNYFKMVGFSRQKRLSLGAWTTLIMRKY